MKITNNHSLVTSFAIGQEKEDKDNDIPSSDNITNSHCSDKPQKRTSTERKRFSNPLDRFKANPTRKHAIHAHCYQCVGCGADSWWKTEIGNCQINDCSLWIFRPYQQRLKDGD